MKKINVIIFNTKEEILLLYENGKYTFPYIKNNSNDNKNLVINFLKDEYEIDASKNLLSKKYEDEDDIFYCYDESVIKEDVKDKLHSFWINKNIFENIVINNNSKEPDKVFDAFFLPITPEYSKKLNEFYEYKNVFLSILAGQIDLIKVLKQEEYINSIKSQNILDLTYSEAELIGKKEEWKYCQEKAYHLFSAIPSLLRDNLFLVEKEKKLSEKNYLTPNVFYKSYLRYKDMTVDEIKKDLKEREKIKNKKKK